MEIRFKTPDNFDQEFVLNTVASIVSPKPNVISKCVGYKWALDISNNWWMDFDKNNDEWLVCYRYGDKDLMESLRYVIYWRLGINQKK